MLKRSVFEHSSVKQYCEAFDELGYDVADITPIVDMAQMKASAVTSSQASEDGFNACKNSRLVNAMKHHRKPEKLYGAILSKDAARAVHRYKNVPQDANIGSRSVLIKRETFAPKVKHSTFPLAELAPTQASPPW